MRASMFLLTLFTLGWPSLVNAQSAPPPLRNDTLSASKGARMDSVSRDPNARLSPTRDTVKSIRTYQHLLTYGDCISRLGNNATKILAMKPFSKAERSETAVLRERAESCQLGQVENIHSLVRGALAEAMYHRTVKQAPGQKFDASRASAFVAANEAFNKDRDDADEIVIGATNCMVASNPDIAHAVLSSDHGSVAEAAAMDQLFSMAPGCAGPQRPTDLSKSFLRAFVADSAWQYARWIGGNATTPRVN